eukprot:TRINITY_DN2305_c0_g3_i2.p1 TRINITY_DN2305_c0_g3~~TRINITY_DN2305_c0_g3_i2.p1  ORF type:complete len:382 (+),score=85.10 TRINITY_DN2305_c0_g3_i2:83-1228(+)
MLPAGLEEKLKHIKEKEKKIEDRMKSNREKAKTEKELAMKNLQKAIDVFVKEGDKFDERDNGVLNEIKNYKTKLEESLAHVAAADRKLKDQWNVSVQQISSGVSSKPPNAVNKSRFDYSTIKVSHIDSMMNPDKSVDLGLHDAQKKSHKVPFHQTTSNLLSEPILEKKKSSNLTVQKEEPPQLAVGSTKIPTSQPETVKKNPEPLIKSETLPQPMGPMRFKKEKEDIPDQNETIQSKIIEDFSKREEPRSNASLGTPNFVNENPTFKSSLTDFDSLLARPGTSHENRYIDNDSRGFNPSTKDQGGKTLLTQPGVRSAQHNRSDEGNQLERKVSSIKKTTSQTREIPKQEPTKTEPPKVASFGVPVPRTKASEIKELDDEDF